MVTAKDVMALHVGVSLSFHEPLNQLNSPNAPIEQGSVIVAGEGAEATLERDRGIPR